MSKVKTQTLAPVKESPSPVVELKLPTPRKTGGRAPLAPQQASANGNGAPHPTRAAAILTAPARSHGAASRAHTTAFMQRAVGNTRLSRLLNPTVQAMLEISKPDDPSEHEADRVADAVMHMPDETQAERPPVTVEAGAQPDAGRGGGQPLSKSQRDFMEPRFGRSFEHVRLHTDRKAQEEAAGIGARAFTQGADVSFGAGSGPEDKKLLAHELTHVAQLNAAGPTDSPPVQRKGDDTPSKLQRLEGMLKQLNVPEEDVITVLGQLTPEEKQTVLAGGYKKRIARALNREEMIRAVNNLNPNLDIKLDWIKAAVTFTSSIDYSDIKDMITSASQAERDALKTKKWRDFFVKVCTDETLAQALNDLDLDLKTKLEWMTAEGVSAKSKQVKFIDHHPMASYGGNSKNNPSWSPGASDHAVAYVKDSKPTISAQFEFDGNLSRVITKPLSVRVKEAGAVLAAKAGFAQNKGRLDATDLEIAGLSGSGEVRQSKYTLQWEVSEDGAIWASIGQTGVHLVYWLFDKPSSAIPFYNLAAAKATRYAAGAGSAGAVADAIRHGPRGIDGLTYNPGDPINEDPLAVYGDGVGICTDYANLLAFLALSVGLKAHTVIFWGGFQIDDINVWVALGGEYGELNMVNVKSPVADYNPSEPKKISPQGWSFNYHAIANIEGIKEDAALDRKGIDAKAAYAGWVIRLVESSGAAALPPATIGAAYSQVIPRKDRQVDISIRDYGPKLTSSDISTNRYILYLPKNPPSPYEEPLNWKIQTGDTLPPGLSLNNSTGIISGTPTSSGTYSFRVAVTTKDLGLGSTFSLTINVTP